MKLGYLTKNTSVGGSIKDVDGKKGIITGYFAHFNNEDAAKEIIPIGAFAKTIKEIGPDSSQPRGKHLRNHLITEPVGKLLVLKEDATGLYYESQAGSNFIAQDTVKMIESELITEHSFGYDVIRDQDAKDGTRILLELKFWEGSCLTGWGCNEMTGGAALKSLGRDKYLQLLEHRTKALEKFCRNTTATDELIEALLIENKQLSQHIIDLSTYAAEDAPTPDKKGKKLNFALLID